MNTTVIPDLSPYEVNQYFVEAKKSKRARAPKILHKQGDYNNSVFNFILEDSYMHPHLHPSNEKVEKMYLIEGSFALIIFDDKGKILISKNVSSDDKKILGISSDMNIRVYKKMIKYLKRHREEFYKINS